MYVYAMVMKVRPAAASGVAQQLNLMHKQRRSTNTHDLFRLVWGLPARVVLAYPHHEAGDLGLSIWKRHVRVVGRVACAPILQVLTVPLQQQQQQQQTRHV